MAVLRRLAVIALLFGWGMCVLSLPAEAATEAQKQSAIDNGLAWLASQQLPDGSWNWSGYPDADTGAALLAFQGHGYHAGGGTYGGVVGDGLNYLFNTASKSGGNIWWAQSGEDSYVTGLVLPAIATSGTPGAVVGGSGPLAGMTYQQVAQGVVDYFTAGQIPAGNPYGWVAGGWGYSAYPSTRADNSTSQWPAIGLLFANSRMGIAIPDSVKIGLANWVSYIQNPSGGSGYDGPYNLVNEAKTGGLLVQMRLLGMPLSDSDVQAAIAYLNANWLNGASGWDGNLGQPYAMWSIYKGLETTIGLDDMTTITNLRPDPGDVDNPDHGWNWWEDYCDWLVNTQNPEGSWSGYYYWPSTLATAWDVNILLATHVAPPVVPEPLTAMGFVLALGGLVRYVRRRA
jgi:hypothetical protein